MELVVDELAIMFYYDQVVLLYIYLFNYILLKALN